MKVKHVQDRSVVTWITIKKVPGARLKLKRMENISKEISRTVKELLVNQVLIIIINVIKRKTGVKSLVYANQLETS